MALLKHLHVLHLRARHGRDWLDQCPPVTYIGWNTIENRNSEKYSLAEGVLMLPMQLTPDWTVPLFVWRPGLAPSGLGNLRGWQ